jgi:hypothetical protein
MHLSGDYGHPALYAGYNPGYSSADPIVTDPGAEVNVKIPERGGLAGGADAPRQLSVDELFYDPGTSLVDNQPSAPIGGHSDHVHFGSESQRDLLRAAKIAEKLGLDVRENPLFEPVDPVHVTDSMHYDTETLRPGLRDRAQALGGTGNEIGAAIDVTGDPAAMARYDSRIAQLAGAPLSGAGTSTGGVPVSSDGTALGSLAGSVAGAGGGTLAPRDNRAPISISPIQNPLSARAALPAGFAGGAGDQDTLSALQALLTGDTSTTDETALSGLLSALIPKRRR